MFEMPTGDGDSFIKPGRYILKVVKLEPMPPSTEHPDWKPSIRWYFHMVDCETKKLKMDSADPTQPYEWWLYSSISLAKGPRAKTRPWVEAFLGRELTAADTDGAALAQALLGKKAEAMVGVPTGSTRDGILSIAPYREPAKSGKATAAPSEAVQVLENDLPPEQRTGAAEQEEAFAF